MRMSTYGLSMVFLIADDHDLFLSGLQSLLQDAFPSAQIISVSSLSAVHQELAMPTKFQLVLIDLFMPGMQGAASIRQLTQLSPTTPIIVVSAEDSPLTIQTCLTAGASGYVPKSSESNTIIQAITSVIAGGQFSPPSVRNHPLLNISHRQEEILICIAEGKTNREISEALDITEGTVKQYVSHLLKMLDVDNRTRAAAKASKILGLTIR